VQHAFILLKPIVIVKRSDTGATFFETKSDFFDGGFL